MGFYIYLKNTCSIMTFNSFVSSTRRFSSWSHFFFHSCSSTIVVFKSKNNTDCTFIGSSFNSFIIDLPVANLTCLLFSFSLGKLNLSSHLKTSLFKDSNLTLENLDFFLLRGHHFILLLNFDVIFIAIVFKLVVFEFHWCQLTSKVVIASLKVFFLDQDVGEFILVFVLRCNSAYGKIVNLSVINDKKSYLLVGVWDV